MRLYRAFFVVATVVVLTSCIGTQEQRQAAYDGALAGAKEFVAAVPSAASAVETGGWTAALMTLIFGAVRGVQKGLAVSRAHRVDEVVEGVQKANGGAKT